MAATLGNRETTLITRTQGPSIEVGDRDGAQVVRICGRVGASTVADLRARLHGVLEDAAGPLWLDLEQFEIGDRTALGLLVGFHRRAHRAGRPLHIVAINDRTKRMLRGIRFERRVAA